jgi:hypothetical protein
MSFLRTSQTSAGTVVISDVLKWINTTGWYNNPTLSGIQCGWEILDTSGQQNFTMNSYSVTITSGGGGGGNLISNGTYTLTNVNSGLVLDVPGGSTANSVQLDQWSSNGGSNQKWTLTNLGGNVVELTSQNSGKAVDVYGWSTANGGVVDQYTYAGQNNQKWTVISVGNGAYELSNVNSGKALEVQASSKSNGGLIDQNAYSGSANQKWTIK